MLMNVKIISEKQIAKDAAKMTLLSLAMQTAGMIFNVKLSDMAGTSAVGLMSLDNTEFARFAAGSVFIAVPIVIFYFALSKFLISGLSAGAVKQ